eukprot:gnl/Chilomastix_cuspidata/5858.p1 GENE.gnl/Chilomastix_cuspidata/5858~~gnl/Chilomastix_cuspidata/5858.p1  ORF type:complete len:283 (-),score=113.88 gnl/Chilomastix_cuspidata/5858:69-917(-)
MGLLHGAFVVMFWVSRFFARIKELIRYFIDKISSLFYPRAWNLKSRERLLRKIPKHLAITGDIDQVSGVGKFQSLERIASFIVACMDLGVQQFTLFLPTRHWRVQDVNELNSHLFKHLRLLELDAAMCTLLKTPANSWFKQRGKYEDEPERRKVIIVSPSCSRGSFAEADHIVLLQDRRNSHAGYVATVQHMARNGRASVAKDDILRIWPGVLPSRVGVDKKFVDLPDLLLVFSRRRTLHSFPPIGTRNSEILFLPPLRYSTVNTLFRALQRFGNSQQRRGA